MNISLIRKQQAEGSHPFNKSTPYDKRYGFWGVVREVHPEDCTVHVLTDMGILLTGVRVASAEWVTVEKDKPLTGERHLPPIDTYVFCMMPTGEYTSAFVLCSGFTRQEAVHADFKKKGEDAAMTHEKVDNSRWHYTCDYRTGTRKLCNKVEEPTISIEVDQETDGDEKATITVHGMVITATKDDGLNITTDKKITLKDKEGFTYETEGDASISAKGSVTVKSKKSGTLEFGNNIATLGEMVSDLLGYLAQLKTVGSPASHTAAPDFITNIQALKTKWGQVFK
ncbi:hypothetical protein E4N71_11120 [Treponema vincentii]|uniref:hypothetical protein n=1 Tax=Treponema vincentii TaxID=69710 RepID=UPI003D8A4CC7